MQDQGVTLGGSVIALSGRRIDAVDAQQTRFPLSAAQLVRLRIAELLRREGARVLVCSAACGADLIALEEAGRLGVRRRVVLPFAPERFRETSVTDRPGDWGRVFDRVVTEARHAGDLVVVKLGDNEDEAYASANKAIVREAQTLCRNGPLGAGRRPIAAIVWEGAPRTGDDMTEGFRRLAAEAGFDERIILTL
jgi:hypothetical protein